MTTTAEHPDDRAKVGPQQDRSRATRARLLQATIDCLAAEGWAATTVAAVATRAGVSRGAAQHHFPTREDLILAALDQVFDDLIRDAGEEIRPLTGGESVTETVVLRIIELYTGRVFKAAVHVWTAAAADPALRTAVVPLEAKFARAAHGLAIESLGVDDSDPVVHRLVQATLDLARGFGLADLLTDDRERRVLIARVWAAQLESAFARSAGA